MLAQQSLQADFDPNLVRMFDKHAQGALAQSVASAGDAFTLLIDGATTRLPAGRSHQHVRLRRFRVGRRRQRRARGAAGRGGRNGRRARRPDGYRAAAAERRGQAVAASSIGWTISTGRSGTLHPGDAGYEAAAAARAYATGAGGRTIDGPGYGNYAQAALLHVNAGDLIAMKLTNSSSGTVFWAFSQANESTGQRSRRASVELRAECLGLGRHQRRRRPRLQ